MIFKNKAGKHLNDSLSLIITFSLIIGALFLTQVNNPTGQVTSTSIESDSLSVSAEFTEYSNFNLSLNNVERISSTGSFVGEIGSSAKIYAVTESGAKLLITELIIDEDSQSNSVVTSNVVASQPIKSDDSMTFEDNKTKENKKNDKDKTIDETETTSSQINPTDDPTNTTVNSIILEENETIELNNTITESEQENTSTIETDATITDETEQNETEQNETEIVEPELIVNETITNETITNESNINETQQITNETTNTTLTNETNINETQQITNETPINESTNTTQTNETTTDELIKLVEFSDSCTRTCDLMNVNIKEIIIEVDAGKLFLDELNYVHEVTINETKADIGNENNSEINLINNVEDITLSLNDNVTIHADDYFMFPINTTFDAKSGEGYMITSDDDQIIFIAKKTGEWITKLYATDGNDLVESNDFKIMIVDDLNIDSNDTQIIIDENINGTENDTFNESQSNETILLNETSSLFNETIINGTINETITNETTINDTLTNGTLTINCDDSNPNARDLECLMKNDTSYFPSENLLIENKKAEVVGKFTPIGNFLIKGDYIQETTTLPQRDDYQLGYANDRGEFVPTVWINSDTGDLHLKGRLTEANANIVLDPGLTAIINKRDILLASINKKTGDMILRGNIIPYRRSFG